MAENDARTPQKKPVQYRIDDGDASSILIMATLFDIISIIPIANDVSVFVAQPILYLAFRMRGVDPLGPKNWIWFLAAWIVELIPGLSILPTIVLESFRWIAISRVEDRITSKGLVAESEKAKALARRFLQQKRVQDAAKGAEKGAVANSARRADGSFDRDKIREKRGQIADRKSDLDKALAPDPNAGVRNLPRTFDNGSNAQRQRTRTEQKLTPEEAANADLSRRSQSEEVTDYGPNSPALQDEEAA